MAAKPQCSKVESVDNFFDSFLREALCERLLTTSSGDAIGEEAAEDGTERGHRGVVEPETFVAGGEENRGDIHAAGKRHHGAVEQAEGNQADSTEVQKLSDYVFRCG